MNFKFDNKDYDSDKLSDNGKACLARLENISVKENQLSAEFSDLQVLKQHYNNVLKKELLEEQKKEAKEEAKWVKSPIAALGGTNTRISLAFNTFYKGSVGSNTQLTELIL